MADCAPNVNIFKELQVVHDTGYFSSQVSPEEDWQQVNEKRLKILDKPSIWNYSFTDLLWNGKVSERWTQEEELQQ